LAEPDGRVIDKEIVLPGVVGDILKVDKPVWISYGAKHVRVFGVDVYTL